MVYFQFHGVRLLVPDDDPLGKFAVARQQRLSGRLQNAVHVPPHLGDPLPDGLELRFKLPAGMLTQAHPNLPVMYSSVCCCAGFVNIFLVSPNSTRWPRYMKAV